MIRVGGRLLAGVLGLFLVAAVPAAEVLGVEVLSPAEFTQHCLEKVRAAAPRATISAPEPLKLGLTHRESGESTILLRDAYEAYLLAPDKLDEIIELFVAGVRETAPAENSIDPALIVPVVRERAWLREVGALDSSPVVYDELNEDLVIVYAEDAPNSLSYFSPAELETSKVDRAGLRQLAADNLVRLLPQIERRGEDGVFVVKAGGDFEASLLAIGRVWTKESFPVKGDFVFAAPAIGILFVTGSEDAAGIKRVREMAAAAYGKSSQKLSPKLFVRRDESLLVLPD